MLKTKDTEHPLLPMCGKCHEKGEYNVPQFGIRNRYEADIVIRKELLDMETREYLARGQELSL